MSQVNFENNDLGNYKLIPVRNESGDVFHVLAKEEGVAFELDLIQDPSGVELVYNDAMEGFFNSGANNFSYFVEPQNDGTDLLLQAVENVEFQLDDSANVKYEPNIELLLKSDNVLQSSDVIGENEELTVISNSVNEETTAPIVVLSEDDLFTCKLCNDGSTFRGESKSMVTHLLKIHKERIYICDVCGQYFRKNPELSSHMKEHLATEQGDFQCEVCNRIFTSLRLFKIHKRMHSPQNKAWNCEICQKKFGSKNLLSEHFNIHTGARPYQCGICKKSYSSKYTFKSHEKTHDYRPRPFKCTECTKCFLTQQNLNQHKRTHSGLKEFACLQCDKKFGTAHSLRVHSIIHTGCKPFICEHCHKGFARKAEITDHLRTHTGERPFECNMCKATFAQRSNLQSHKRCTHWNDKRYKCQHCVKEVGFKRRRLLDYHIRVCHTGERPYKCDICLATFVYPEHFKKHKRVHTGEKPHSCPICLKKFSSRDNRNSHLFTHSDKKPYECAICGLCFMRKPLLMQHMSREKHESNVILLNQPQMKINDQYVTINSNGEILSNEPLTLQPIQTGAKEDSELRVLEGNVVVMDDDSFVIDAEGVGPMIMEGQHIVYAAECNGMDGGEVSDDSSLGSTIDFSEILNECLITGTGSIVQDGLIINSV